MAVSRNIYTKLWGDTKVLKNFTPEDKLFWVYLLTNKNTNLLGCYELPLETIESELGFNAKSIEKIIDRFEKLHKIIEYDFDSSEILIKNWCKYNWVKNTKYETALYKQVGVVKSEKLRVSIFNIFSDFYSKLNNNEETCIPYTYPIHTLSKTTINTNIIRNDNNILSNNIIRNYTNNINNTNNNIYNIYSQILDFWNEKKIIKHKMSENLEKAIKKALTKYDAETIKSCIERYDKILKDDNYFFNYKWGLKDFLTQKNAISEFLEDGSKWQNYLAELENRKKKQNKDKVVKNTPGWFTEYQAQVDEYDKKQQSANKQSASMEELEKFFKA